MNTQQRLLYPHKSDRFRLVQLIAKAERERLQLKQKGVARKAETQQAEISHLEQLETAVDDPAYMVYKPTLMRILKDGLGMSREDTDAVTWVYSGGSLDDPRVADDNLKHLAEILTRVLTTQSFKQAVSKQKPGRKKTLHEQKEGRDASVRVFLADDNGRIEFDRALHSIEEMQGQRLLVSDLPSLLTQPRDSSRVRRLLQRGFSSPDHKLVDEAVDLHMDRARNYKDRIAKYGERVIHSKAAIIDYLNNPDQQRYALRVEERREHIHHWRAKFLQQPNYHIALSDQPMPEVEILIKSTRAVSMRPAGRNSNYLHPSPLRGLRIIHWYDTLSVISWLIDFDLQWAAIPPCWRDNQLASDWLDAALEGSTHTHSCENCESQTPREH